MNKFLPLILCVLFMYGGCQLFTINDGRTSEAFKTEQKGLCDNGVKTVAMLHDEYTELKIKSARSYQYQFDYMVDEKKYTGKITKTSKLTSPTLEITYNSNNPESYTTKDACAVFAKVKDYPASRPQWLEYIGAGIFLLALLFIKGSIVRIFRN